MKNKRIKQCFENNAIIFGLILNEYKGTTGVFDNYIYNQNLSREIYSLIKNACIFGKKHMKISLILGPKREDNEKYYDDYHNTCFKDVDNLKITETIYKTVEPTFTHAVLNRFRSCITNHLRPNNVFSYFVLDPEVIKNADIKLIKKSVIKRLLKNNLEIFKLLEENKKELEESDIS